MIRHSRQLGAMLMVVAVVLLLVPVRAFPGFAPGDIFVSIETGQVQWWTPDGSLQAVLPPTVAGWGEGMALALSGNLYVAHWRADGSGVTGNTVEKYSVQFGQSMGAVGNGYN